jgi:hypothetical protein
MTIVDGTALTRKLQALASAGQLQSKPQRAHLVSIQTLQGRPVYVLRVDRTHTLSFDARSYILREADWSQDGQAWRARLVHYQSLPARDTPSGTFSLTVPPAPHEISNQVRSSVAPSVGGHLVRTYLPLWLVARIEGINPVTLRAGLDRGQTLLQIGAHRYRSATALATALLSAGYEKKLVAEVTHGMRTRAQQQAEYAALLHGVSHLTVTRHPTLIWVPRYRAMAFLVSVTVR